MPIAGARVQPHRSLAGPRAGLRSRRHDADAERPSAEPRRQRDERAAADAGADRRAMQQIDLPLAALPPGEYVVEIKATGEGGEARNCRLPRDQLDVAMRAVVAILVAAGGVECGAGGASRPDRRQRVNARGQAVLDLKPGDFELARKAPPQAVDGVRSGPRTSRAVGARVVSRRIPRRRRRDGARPRGAARVSSIRTSRRAICSS